MSYIVRQQRDVSRCVEGACKTRGLSADAQIQAYEQQRILFVFSGAFPNCLSLNSTRSIVSAEQKKSAKRLPEEI